MPTRAPKSTNSAATATTPADHSSFETPVTLDEEVLQQIKEEKNIMKYQQPPPGLFKQMNKLLQGLVDHVDWAKMSQIRATFPLAKIANHKGLYKVMESLDSTTEKEKAGGLYNLISKQLVICPHCQNNKQRALIECIIFCGKNGNLSNIAQHFCKFHPLLNANKGSNNVSSTGTPVTMQQFIELYAKQMPHTHVKEKFLIQNEIYKCISNLGFPASTVKNPIFVSSMQSAGESQESTSIGFQYQLSSCHSDAHQLIQPICPNCC